MTDKERLEDVKDILKSPGEVFFGSISEDGIVSQDVADAEPYFKWLIEQAERAEGLEKRNMNDYPNGFVSGIEMFKLFLTDECETTGYATNEQINNALHRSVN